MKKYDYLIVGAGLFGAVFSAGSEKKAGKTVSGDRQTRPHRRKYLYTIRDRTVSRCSSVWGAYFPHFGQ